MGKMKFRFEKESYRQLIDGEISALEFIKPILEEGSDYDDPDGGNRGQIINQLMSYHDSDAGAPEINDFDLIEVSFDYKKRTGKIEISYWIYRYYGCSDLNNEEDDYETWAFEINVKEKVVVVHAPDYEPLSPDEEL